MRIHEVSQSEFEALDGPRKLIVHEHARRYAILELGVGGERFGLCWRSDQVEPAMQMSPEGGTVWLGVDQHLAAVDVKGSQIRLSMALDTPLLQLVAERDFVVALTENELLAFNWDGSIRARQGLPELPDFFTVESGVLTVRLVDGEAIRLVLERGGR